MKLERIFDKLNNQIDVSYFLTGQEFKAMKSAMQTPIAKTPAKAPAKAAIKKG